MLEYFMVVCTEMAIEDGTNKQLSLWIKRDY